ncbi:hypothetical protein [Sodaliphilus pleomorphus]|uniref:hypothetical protein n=1 Tax=Sodaliphilus pleomorphus TaxID=2606626 RepID=UPI002409BC1B|nr:hypothetical protein [Sodaliphilus pleomorphus]
MEKCSFLGAILMEKCSFLGAILMEKCSFGLPISMEKCSFAILQTSNKHGYADESQRVLAPEARHKTLLLIANARKHHEKDYRHQGAAQYSIEHFVRDTQVLHST